jgi:hypothetical protein
MSHALVESTLSSSVQGSPRRRWLNSLRLPRFHPLRNQQLNAETQQILAFLAGAGVWGVATPHLALI